MKKQTSNHPQDPMVQTTANKSWKWVEHKRRKRKLIFCSDKFQHYSAFCHDTEEFPSASLVINFFFLHSPTTFLLLSGGFDLLQHLKPHQLHQTTWEKPLISRLGSLAHCVSSVPNIWLLQTWMYSLATFPYPRCHFLWFLPVDLLLEGAKL